MHKDLLLILPLAIAIVVLIARHFAVTIGDDVERIEAESQNEKLEDYVR